MCNCFYCYCCRFFYCCRCHFFYFILIFYRDDTLYLPEPCLISEKAFNEHFSYEKYFQLFSIKQQHHNKEKEETKDTKLLKKTQKPNEHTHPDIFESASTPPVVPTLQYKLHTKYHKISVQTKTSNISQKDREFYMCFVSNQAKHPPKTKETNMLKYQVRNT